MRNCVINVPEIVTRRGQFDKLSLKGENLKKEAKKERRFWDTVIDNDTLVN